MKSTLFELFELNKAELSKWDVNDKVSFNIDDSPSLGLVVGFSYNPSGELLVTVLEFTQFKRDLNPRNTWVNLRNLTKESANKLF